MEMSNCKCHLSSLVMILEAGRTRVTAVRPHGTGGPVALCVCFCHGPASGGHVEHEKASLLLPIKHLFLLHINHIMYKSLYFFQGKNWGCHFSSKTALHSCCFLSAHLLKAASERAGEGSAHKQGHGDVLGSGTCMYPTLVGLTTCRMQV